MPLGGMWSRTPATHGAGSEQSDNEKRIALAVSAAPDAITSADLAPLMIAWNAHPSFEAAHAEAVT
jgi:hypothetical protein